MPDSVSKFEIALEVGGRSVLLLGLSADGGIMRSGTGRADSDEKDVWMGQLPDNHAFQDAVAHLDSSWLERYGRYTALEQLGTPCLLRLTLHTTEGAEGVTLQYEFRYGTESVGPPKEIQDLFRAAVSGTDRWYAERLGRALPESGPAEKSRWKFW